MPAFHYSPPPQLLPFPESSPAFLGDLSQPSHFLQGVPFHTHFPSSFFVKTSPSSTTAPVFPVHPTDYRIPSAIRQQSSFLNLPANHHHHQHQLPQPDPQRVCVASSATSMEQQQSQQSKQSHSRTQIAPTMPYQHHMHPPPPPPPPFGLPYYTEFDRHHVSPTSTPRLSASPNFDTHTTPLMGSSDPDIRLQSGSAAPSMSLLTTSNAVTSLNAPPRRISGACTRCRRLKMRCEFKQGAPACTRCSMGRHECVMEARKPRQAGEKERLKARIKSKTLQMEAAMEKIKAELTETTPLTFVAQKLKLTTEQREKWRDVLAASSTTSIGSGSVGRRMQLEDIKSLLEADLWTAGGGGAHNDTAWTDSSSGSDAGSQRSPSPPNTLFPNTQAPIGFMANFSLHGEEGSSLFRPGPLSDPNLRAILVERGEDAPAILLHDLVSLDDVDVLFDLYFKQVNLFTGLLDENIHTPSAVLISSPFLFTVICAVASRYFPTHAGRELGIYPLAMHYAKTAAASALIDGRKSIEMCQSYLLMALYAPTGKRLEDSRTYFYAGIATRLATELNLHLVSQQPPSARDERTLREWNNKIRTWVVAFNLDRSISLQYGKPHSLVEDDTLRRGDWYQTPFALPYDIHTLAHTKLLLLMTKYHELISALGATQDSQRLEAHVETYEEELATFEAETKERYAREASSTVDEGSVMRVDNLAFFIGHSKLVFLSEVLQHSNDEGSCSNQFILGKAMLAATTVIKVFLGNMIGGKFITSAPDCFFVYASYAATFLLKLIDLKNCRVSDVEQRDRIVQLCSSLVSSLSEVASDDSHPAKLYSRFLAGALKRVCSVPAEIPAHDTSTTTTSSPETYSPQTDHHYLSPPSSAYPDATSHNVPVNEGITYDTSASMSWYSATHDPAYSSPLYNVQPDTGAPYSFGNYLPYGETIGQSQSRDQVLNAGTLWTFGPNESWTFQDVCPSVNLLAEADLPAHQPLYHPPSSSLVPVQPEYYFLS